MRKLTLILLPLLMLLAACDLSSVPWVSTTGKTFHWVNRTGVVTLDVVVDPSFNATYKPILTETLTDMSLPARVNVRYAAGNACTRTGYCVFVKGKPMNGGVGGFGAGADGHIGVGYITMDNSPGQAAINVANVLCHEGYHVLGLNHGTAPGPCQRGEPTAWDVAVADAIHDHRHAT